MNELIEKLKDNEKPLFLLSHEERNVIEKLGAKNCQIFQEFNDQACWCNMMAGKINKLDASYRIRSDYQPEPEFVDLEITEHLGNLGVNRCSGVDLPMVFTLIHCLPSRSNFDCFWFKSNEYTGQSAFRETGLVAPRRHEGKTVYARFRVNK